MRVSLSFLPALACAGLMVGCVRMMGRGRTDRTKDETSEIRELRAEVERLQASVRNADEPVEETAPRP